MKRLSPNIAIELTAEYKNEDLDVNNLYLYNFQQGNYNQYHFISDDTVPVTSRESQWSTAIQNVSLNLNTLFLSRRRN